MNPYAAPLIASEKPPKENWLGAVVAIYNAASYFIVGLIFGAIFSKEVVATMEAVYDSLPFYNN